MPDAARRRAKDAAGDVYRGGGRDAHDEKGGSGLPGEPSNRRHRGVETSAEPRANFVYRRLRERGYEVFAVNPNADEVEGDRAYESLSSIPGGVDAVVIGTRSERAEAAMRECSDLGIKRVWMHRSLGPGSVSEAATRYGRERGITVIDGGCPCMFGPTADGGHKVMRVFATLAGNVPREV